jgi:hypothetical protein
LEELLLESGFCWKKDHQGTYFEDQENSRKIPENSIFPEDSGSQKEESRGARGPTR